MSHSVVISGMEGVNQGVGSRAALVAAGGGKTRTGKAVAPNVKSKPVLVVGAAESRSPWVAAVISARDAGQTLGSWMRERGHLENEIEAAYRLQARMKKRGQALGAAETRPMLLALRAEVVDRINRRVGVGTGRLVADVDTLRAIDGALRQAEAWEREKRGAGTGAPAAAGAAVRGARGARNGAMGARGGGKAAVEASVGALSVGETGGSEGEGSVEASVGAVEALGGGIGGGEGDGGGVMLSVPLAGC